MRYNLIQFFHCFKVVALSAIGKRNKDINLIMARFDTIRSFKYFSIDKARKCNEKLKEECTKYIKKINSHGSNKNLFYDVNQGIKIARDWLKKDKKYDDDFFNKIASKFFYIVAYCALNEKDIQYKISTKILDKKTSIAIYFIAIYIHLKRYESEWYKKYRLKTFDELCNNEKIRLIIMEDIETVAKLVRDAEDPNISFFSCTVA